MNVAKKVILFVVIGVSGASIDATRNSPGVATKKHSGAASGGARKKHHASGTKWLRAENVINLQNLQAISMPSKTFVNPTDGPVLLRWDFSCAQASPQTSPLLSYVGSTTIPKGGQYKLSFINALNYFNNNATSAQSAATTGYNVTVSVARQKGYSSTGEGLYVRLISESELADTPAFDLFHVPTLQ